MARLPLSENWLSNSGWLDAQLDDDWNRRMDALEDRLARQAASSPTLDPERYEIAEELESCYGD